MKREPLSTRPPNDCALDDFTRESVSATSCHLVSSGEEVAHALIDVSVNTAECGSARPEAEVVRPTEQRPVQRIAHFGPRIVIAGHQQIANLCLEPLHALLGRARAQIPIAVRFVTVRSERVAQEVEAFLPSILQRSLGFTSLSVSPSRVIALLVHARASAAYPRLRMTKSSAYAMTCARNACPHPVSCQYFKNRFMF